MQMKSITNIFEFLVKSKFSGLFLLIAGLPIALFTNSLLDWTTIEEIHIFVLNLCTAMAFTGFLIAIHSAQSRLSEFMWISVGFLAIVIYNASYMSLYPAEFSEVFRNLARVTEAMILLSVVFKVDPPHLPKLFYIFLTAALSVGISLFLIYFRSMVESVFTNYFNLYLLTSVVRSIIVLISVISLFALTPQLERKGYVSYLDLRLALLVNIPRELILLFVGSITPFWEIYGNLLTLFFYYFLYRAVISSSLNYPHYMLKQQMDRLESVSSHIVTLNQKLEAADMEINKKNGYLATLSHDLKNPISVLYGGIQLLAMYYSRDTISNRDKLSSYLETMEKNCDQMANLLDSVAPKANVETDDYSISRSTEQL